MNFKITIFQILIFSLFACTNKSGNEKIVFEEEELLLKNWFYPDGSLKEQQTYKEIQQDSFVGHGFYQSFYPSGRLEYFSRLHRGDKIGTVNKYFESGNIKEVWFYNPIGQALYSRFYNEKGEFIKEQKVEQRFPQLIYKKISGNDSLEFKVYSVNIPERKKNVYLINADLEVVDSVPNSTLPYDKFIRDLKCKSYQINVDYYDNKSGKYIETDNFQFTIEA